MFDIYIEQILLICNTILIPTVIFTYKKINNWSSDICDRLVKIEHKLNLEHKE